MTNGNLENNKKENFCENQCVTCKCKVPMIVGAIMFSFVMLVLGIFLGKTYFSGKQSQNTIPASVVSTPTANPKTDPTANWKTYVNKSIGYSIKYPGNWDKLEAEGNYVRFFEGIYNPNLPMPKNYVSISPKANLLNKSVKTWLVNGGILPNPNNISTHIGETDVVIDGIPGVKISTPVNGGQDTVYLPVGNQILQISYIWMEGDEKTNIEFVKNFDQIFSTFKFTEKGLTSTPTISSSGNKTPVVVYEPGGLFNDSEKADLKKYLLDPFTDYYSDLKNPTLTITITKKIVGQYSYSVMAINESGSTYSFLLESGKYWLPECMNSCGFSNSFKLKYPEIVNLAEPK